MRVSFDAVVNCDVSTHEEISLPFSMSHSLTVMSDEMELSTLAVVGWNLQSATCGA